MRILAAIVVGAALAAAATAAALATLTLTATPTTTAYGKAVALNGVLSTHKANQNVKVDATECGQTASKTVGSVKTNATGAYTMNVTPTVNTSYQARGTPQSRRRSSSIRSTRRVWASSIRSHASRLSEGGAMDASVGVGSATQWDHGPGLPVEPASNGVEHPNAKEV